MNTLRILSPVVSRHQIIINYEFEDQTFWRGLDFPDSMNLEVFSNDATFQKLVQYSVIADSIYTFGIEYYDQIELPFALSIEEKVFFEKALLNGLAEFRYRNGVPIQHAVKLMWPDDALLAQPEPKQIDNNRAFVLNGGGKDGVVGMEIAKTLGLDLSWFVSGAADSRDRVVKLSGINEVVNVARLTDPYIKATQKFSGHRPMSLYVAMVASLTAYVDNRHYVIAANEYSASFGNLVVDGFSINHQYTKSFEFEQAVHRLFSQFNIPIYYFSITRPLYELQVLRIFANHTLYHDSFLSCNKGMMDDTWCLSCAKCAFVVGSMYIYSPESALRVWDDSREIFNENKLVDELIELINPDSKPLECIGTLSENRFLLTRLVEMQAIIMTSEQQARFSGYMAAGDNVAEAIDLDEFHRAHDFPRELEAGIFAAIATQMTI